MKTDSSEAWWEKSRFLSNRAGCIDQITKSAQFLPALSTGRKFEWLFRCCGTPKLRSPHLSCSPLPCRIEVRRDLQSLWVHRTHRRCQDGIWQRWVWTVFNAAWVILTISEATRAHFTVEVGSGNYWESFFRNRKNHALTFSGRSVSVDR